MNNSGITPGAAKHLMKFYIEELRTTGTASALSPTELVDSQHLWMADGWTHLGCCLVVCLNNSKMVEQYVGGKVKILDNLIGMTVKFSNMTVDASIVKEMMPIVIETYFK